jgi:hypothetical protein
MKLQREVQRVNAEGLPGDFFPLANRIPLLVRRGGCGIAADRVVAHKSLFSVSDHPVRSIKGGFATFF